jgi:beta-alanine--pyruvate transaminase
MPSTAGDARRIFDGTAGLNAGHGRREISEAVSRQAAPLGFAPTFRMGQPLTERLASAIRQTR